MCERQTVFVYIYIYLFICRCLTLYSNNLFHPFYENSYSGICLDRSRVKLVNIVLLHGLLFLYLYYVVLIASSSKRILLCRPTAYGTGTKNFIWKYLNVETLRFLLNCEPLILIMSVDFFCTKTISRVFNIQINKITRSWLIVCTSLIIK